MGRVTSGRDRDVIDRNVVGLIKDLKSATKPEDIEIVTREILLLSGVKGSDGERLYKSVVE